MSRCALRLLLWSALPLLAGTDPKPKASDYPVHTAVSNVSIGAEYLVRSFSGRNQTFFARDHLVVEIAVYPPSGQSLKVSSGQFTLRINKKDLILPQAPEFLAAGFRYPDWEQRPSLEAIGGVGDAGVIIGRPESRERFPGDPRPGQTRLPPPPRAPAPDDRSGLEKQPPPRADEVVVEAALPEGEVSSPAAGYLYFPYKGKTKSIRSLELLYRGPSGAATLRLY